MPDSTPFNIPGDAFRRALQARQPAAVDALNRVLESGQLILGSEVSRFEEEFAEFVGAPHAVGVGSGTDALILALRAVGIGDQDEVLTVANGPVPTASAIRAVGAQPRFVDIDPLTMQMDVTQVESRLTPQTKAIIPVHLYGGAVDLDPLLTLAQSHQLAVIEDCAQATGTLYRGQHVGTFGTIGCFSFYPTKNLSALGDGGACVTNQAELKQRLHELRMYGYRDRPIAELDGLNSRLDELQAAILRDALQHLPDQLQRRDQHAATYLEQLQAAQVELPGVTSDTVTSWHQFVIRSTHRDELQQALRDASIHCGIHYAWPVHLMPAFRHLGYEAGSLPETERACERALSLPILPDLTADEVQYVVSTIGKWAQRG